MGAIASHPTRDKEYDEGTNQMLNYAVCAMQGWRMDMEDAHTIRLNIDKPFDKWSFFAIYDGHNGSFVAMKSSELLLSFILESNEFKEMKFDHNGDPTNLTLLSDGIRKGFHRFDEYLQTIPCLNMRIDKSGTTATCIFLTPKFIVFVNLGDSRSMIIRDDKCYFQTMDHKPDCTDESKRIYNAGGTVINNRINGCLAVSRCLGDFSYKQNIMETALNQMVSPDPTVTIVARYNSQSHQYYKTFHDVSDQMLVLACDGIWDVMSCDELARYLTSRIGSVESLKQLTEEVVELCFHKGSKDNMSFLIVYFGGAIAKDPILILEDKYTNKRLEDSVKEYLNLQPLSSKENLYHYLEELEFSNLPPGGLLTKRFIIDRFYDLYTNEEESKMTPDSIREKNRIFLDFTEHGYY